MSFFISKDKFSYTLLISLKSSSIDFQLIKTNTSNKKEVLFIERHLLLLENSQDPQIYTSQYIKELTAVFEKNHLKIKQIVGSEDLSIYILLYAPWFTSKIESLFYKESIILNNDFIKKELEHTGIESKLQTLEKQIVKIKTNGYIVTDINDLKCSNVEIEVYSSYISFDIYTILNQSVTKYFDTAKSPQFCTSPLMVLDSIKKFLIKEDNIIFLTIGSEITEVGIIEDDALSNFSTFPIGIHDFLRSVQTNIKTYDYDLLYQKEVVIKNPEMQGTFDSLKQSWLNSFIQTLDFFKKQTPHKIVLITDPKTKDFFSIILTDSIKSNDQNTLKNYRIINFDISTLKDIITYKTPVGDNELQITLEALI